MHSSHLTYENCRIITYKVLPLVILISIKLIQQDHVWVLTNYSFAIVRMAYVMFADGQAISSFYLSLYSQSLYVADFGATVQLQGPQSPTLIQCPIHPIQKLQQQQVPSKHFQDTWSISPFANNKECYILSHFCELITRSRYLLILTLTSF